MVPDALHLALEPTLMGASAGDAPKRLQVRVGQAKSLQAGRFDRLVAFLAQRRLGQFGALSGPAVREFDDIAHVDLWGKGPPRFRGGKSGRNNAIGRK